MSGATPSQRSILLNLQQQALAYFLDNQTDSGLVRDRQANHGPRRLPGWCSTAATGMGLVALALSSAEPYRLLTPSEATGRVRTALETALERLPHDHGILPHFLDSDTLEPRGTDVFSTADSSWLAAGALWASAFLRDAHLENLAGRLYNRVDWRYWTVPQRDSRGLLRHGKRRGNRFLASSWDRLNGETVFLYVLGAGAEPDRALPPQSGSSLRLFYGTAAGLRFNNADLGLFAFEYGLDLLDLGRWRAPGGVDLAAEARLATRANYLTCRAAAAAFATYRHFWGLSDGDGPGDSPAASTYRAYGPGQPLDGTAHLTATLAAIANAPAEVLENLERADRDITLGVRGRYGFSNVNRDRHWVGGDMVGIDAGAAVLALDNILMDGRVRRVFHTLSCVDHGLRRLGFTREEG